MIECSGNPARCDQGCVLYQSLWRGGLLVCLLLCLLVVAGFAFSSTKSTRLVSLVDPPEGSIGHWLYYFQEQQPLAIQDVLTLDNWQPVNSSTPQFGIGAPAVWLYLGINHVGDEPLQRQLMIGVTWLDELDVYLLTDNDLQQLFHAGDLGGDRVKAIPGRGFVVDHLFEPGISDLFIRVTTADPMVIPVQLLTPEAANDQTQRMGYWYGALYGYLLALFAYNFLLFAGLRERSYLDYSLYLGAFVLTSVAYTGHGYAWLWTESPRFQNYVILVMMVVYGIVGLRFAVRFLHVKRYAPSLVHGLVVMGVGALAMMFSLVWLDAQSAAAWLAFSFTIVCSILMMVLGILILHRGEKSAFYYLGAVTCAAIGACFTALSVWGWIPHSILTYHAVEIGVILESTLLALALSHQIRVDRQARKLAEELSRTDPLTGLFNRRAFSEQAELHWLNAQRHKRPLSVLLLDLDHFKMINDLRGHAAGDQALVAVAALLKQSLRGGDVAARWGGEEFILLLPETGSLQACALAERLCQQVRTLVLNIDNVPVYLAASIGVATRHKQTDLEALIREADTALYQAKASGRNRVCVAPEATALAIAPDPRTGTLT